MGGAQPLVEILTKTQKQNLLARLINTSLSSESTRGYIL